MRGGIPVKSIANLISLSRIVLSLLMIPMRDRTVVFVALYLASGLSDVLDGMIARRTKSQSLLGARLDSVADLFLFGAILAILILKMWDELKPFLPCLLIVLSIRLINMVIALRKFHQFVFGLHTWGNKLTGLAVYVSPLLLLVFKPAHVILPAFGISVLAALEETAIHLVSTRIDLNRKSFFLKG
jgi:CDP-diacylglycerol--glycerol-3-phosphate 3-phosphatidyltransferase